jgi:hypothetical protein
LQVTPDGSDVVVASGSPYVHQVFKVSDLSPDGQYDTATYPDSVAIAADGTVLAGSSDWYGDSVFVFAPGDPDAVKSYPLPSDIVPPDGLATAGLAVSPDGTELFAMTTDPYGAHPVLVIFPDPEQADSTLALIAPPRAHRGETIRLSGSLAGAAQYVGGQDVHVTRTDRRHPSGVTIVDLVTAPDGSISFTDAPGVTGTVTYHLSYAGDAHLASSTATATVLVR